MLRGTATHPGGILLSWMLGQIVGMAGTRLINVAVPWFVLVTTREPTLAGVAAFAQMAPMVLIKTLAGPLIDRIGAVRVAVTADLASCLAVAAVPLLHQLGLLTWPVLVVVAAIEGSLRGPGDSAKYALCPRLAELTGRPMERITGLANTVDRTGSAVGAGLGGLVIAAVGAPSALLLSCVTFVLAALFVGVGVGRRLPSGPAASDQAASDQAASDRARSDRARSDRARSEPEPEVRAPGPVASYWRQLREGWVFWHTDTVLVSITTLVALTNLLDQAYLAVLVPEWAVRGGAGADVVGVVFGIYTAAAVAGSVTATAVADRLPRLPTCVVAFLLTGPPRYLALALGVSWVPLLALVALAGFASGFLNPVIGAVVFGRIPAPLVGRVSSLQTSLCWLLIPFGGLVGGLLINALGGATALLVCGLVYLGAGLVPVLIPAWRTLGARTEATPAAG